MQFFVSIRLSVSTPTLELTFGCLPNFTVTQRCGHNQQELVAGVLLVIPFIIRGPRFQISMSSQSSENERFSICFLWSCLTSSCFLLFQYSSIAFTHTHPFNGPLSGTTQVTGTRKVKPIWILLEQETVSGSGISWAICKSAPRSRQITTPASHHSVFTGRMPFLSPINSVKALKAHSSIEFTVLFILF